MRSRREFRLAIVDLRLADEDGITLMEKLHAIFPGIPVIILTGHASVEGAVDAMKRGAYTYLTKPFDPRELVLQIGRAFESCKLASENQMLKGMLKEKYDFANIVAKSEKMQQVLEAVSRIAKTDSTVYIHGESGTGKELIAKAIHLASPRKDEPFVAINCAAIPETLLESELFGHENGAFTGAVEDQGSSLKRTGARCFWMRSATCRSRFRSSCSVLWRNGNFIPSAVKSRFRWTCGSS